VPERVVVGGSVAALVAADALSEGEEPVRLLLPQRGVGGGFAPIHREGRVLELGVRLLELAYEGVDSTPPPLRDYRPALGAHRPYAPLIEDWMRGLLDGRISEVPRPRMLFDGRVVDDLYFTTDPLALREALDPAERAVIARESETARVSAGCDAGLLDPSRSVELEALSAEQASLSNHGPRFHERFIAPIAEKIMAGGARDALATLRRKLWLPLFWPATLAQACGGEKVLFRPERPFHTVTPDGCGGVVEALMKRIESSPRTTVETAGPLTRVAASQEESVELSFAGGMSLRTRGPVLGPSPGELFAAAGLDYSPTSARSVICWLEVRPADLTEIPSLLNIVDPELAALRISSGGRGSEGMQLLTVELNHDLPEDEIAAAAIEALCRTGLLEEGAEIHVVMSAAARTFPLPTQENAERFARAHSALTDLGLEAEIVGGACDFGADALGEQIVQGLRAAEVLR
jgi:hypothetical protein